MKVLNSKAMLLSKTLRKGPPAPAASPGRGRVIRYQVNERRGLAVEAEQSVNRTVRLAIK